MLDKIKSAVRAFFEQRRQRELEREAAAIELLSHLRGLKDDVAILKDQDCYFTLSAIDKGTELRRRLKAALQDQRIPRKMRAEAVSYAEYLDKLPALRTLYNKAFIERKKTALRQLFGDVEGHALDCQQIECIVREDDNILVVAGAGSGKTTTVVGKVKYLLSTGQCTADDLLVLSYTNASAAEMSNRIHGTTKAEIDVMTFHKLGLSIITEVEGKKASIENRSVGPFVRTVLSELAPDNNYLKVLISYFVSHLKEYRDPFEYTREDEYLEVIGRSLRTLKGETVKSLEEVEIANFLLLNNIEYVYEGPYEVDTATMEYSQYRPDFFLPGYGMYIEHFGINRNGDVPKFFTGKGGKSPRQAYHDGIDWKRQTHRNNGTRLVETYSYQKYEGTLLSGLHEKLEAEGVRFVPLDAETISSILHRAEDEMAGLIELMSTFLNLVKSNNIRLDELRGQATTLFRGPDLHRINGFLDLFEPIYQQYESDLIKRDVIDFNDMINRATRYVLEGKCTRPYKYIIIDEYQDISRSRFELVKALRVGSSAKLMCVGDDWQSIYRFNGSDVSFFCDFEKYWGSTERCFIETTYRFGPSLIDVSGTFIMRNPSQISKQLRSPRGSEGLEFGLITSSSDFYVAQDLKDKLRSLPQDSNVLLLGRYNYDIRPLLGDDLRGQARSDTVHYTRRPDLSIEFMTIHGSKGLQADYVFVINNKRDRFGFPSQIQDDQILRLVLERKESFPYAEERRLFYVALTRAKKKVWLLAVRNKQSCFASELESYWERELEREKFRCPVCGNGRMEYKRGRNGPFWGCSNYTRGCNNTSNVIKG